MRAEVSEGAGITGKSYHFNAMDNLSVTNTDLLKTNTDSITLQAWVNTTVKKGNIISKANMYELRIEDGKPMFIVGTATLTSQNSLEFYTESSQFVHLTAVATADSAMIYANGQRIAESKLNMLSGGGLVPEQTVR